jgi:hypothetical protein
MAIFLRQLTEAEKPKVKKTEVSGEVELLHGTTSAFIDSLLNDGILPVGMTGNVQFNYVDYGRKGVPKHPNAVYLTDDLPTAIRYADNAAKKNGGFPMVVRVKVKEDNMSWDDDAFYRFNNRFDFGTRDDKGNLTKKPKQSLWRQSMKINHQATHIGRILFKDMLEFYIESKWVTPDTFKKVLDVYKSMKVDVKTVSQDELNTDKKLSVKVDGGISFDVDSVNRYAFFHNLTGTEDSFDQVKKLAASLKIMEQVTKNIGEWGQVLEYLPSFKKIGFNPAKSGFNYVFSGYRTISSDDEVTKRMKEEKDKDTAYQKDLKKVVELKASQEEFEDVYDFSIDFVGDVVNYCTKVLKHNNSKIIEVLESIGEKYKDSYDQIEAEIDYLKNKKM